MWKLMGIPWVFTARRREHAASWIILWAALASMAPLGPALGQAPELQHRSLLPGLDWIQWLHKDAPQISILRVDPGLYRFRVMHFRSEGATQPLTLAEWMDRSQALAVFNAGQYYPDFSYMGLLVSGGRRIRPNLHRLFQALFLAEPLEKGLPMARILDLAEEEFQAERPGYLEVAQSFMLLDRWKGIRVRRTPNMAARTVLAEEEGGNLLVLLTQGPYTLWELAEELRNGPFPILRAMCMDGGEEAQLGVRTRDFTFPAPSGPGQQGAVYYRALPTVIAIFPRD
jgi:hypothetical protein